MRNRTLILVLLGAAFAAAGCGKDYEQRRLDEQSPEFQRVATMLQDLRQAGQDGLDEHLDEHGAADLNAQRTEALRAVLRELQQAQTATLVQLDAFGPQTYRATIELRVDEEPKTVAVLLVAPEEDTFYWAGMN